MKLRRLPILVFTLGALALSPAATAWAGSEHHSGEPTPSPVSRGVQLDPNNRSEIYNNLPPEKQAAIDRMNELRDQVRTHPLPDELPDSLSTDRKTTPGPTRTPPGYKPAGNGANSYGVCGMEHRADREWSNVWWKKSPERDIEVCVVSEGRPGGAGVFVTFWRMAEGGRQPAQRWFPLDGVEGTLLAIDGFDDVVLLRDTAGSEFWFDAASLRYVERPDAAAAAPTRVP